MENILEVKKEKKHLQIVIDQKIAERLRNMNKGSYNAAISFLLNVNPEKSLREEIRTWMQESELRLDKLEDMFQRLVNFNKLKC